MQWFEQQSLCLLQWPPLGLQAARAVPAPLNPRIPARVPAQNMPIACRRDVLVANDLVNASNLLESMFFFSFIERLNAFNVEDKNLIQERTCSNYFGS